MRHLYRAACNLAGRYNPFPDAGAVLRQGEKRAHGAEKRARPTYRTRRHKP